MATKEEILEKHYREFTKNNPKEGYPEWEKADKSSNEIIFPAMEEYADQQTTTIQSEKADAAKLRSINKEIACKFMTWFTTPETNEQVEEALMETKTDGITENLYDLWFERYFNPDVINNK